MKKIFLMLPLLLLSFAVFSAESLLINGAGATFPYPLYSKWFYEYQKINPSVKINYQSIGSGGGIKQITEKTVDFGASDAPMSAEELKKLSAPLLHIPTVLGGIVLSYNAPAVGNDLKLSGPVIADIFLGNIKKWNDPKIVKLNPGKNLPAQDIMVAHRTDGSGTSYVFTEYLSKVSPQWKTKVGVGKSVNWPAGLGGKGNEGVTALVQQTPGAIGYVELSYALQNKLPFASVQNRSGNFILPTTDSISKAAVGINIPADYRVSLTDSAGLEAYPISSFTYLLIYKTQRDAAKGKALVSFLKWALHDGEKMAPALYYAPLPDPLVTRLDQTIQKIVVAH